MRLSLIFILLNFTYLFSQAPEFLKATSIDSILRVDANTVVRKYEMLVEINAVDRMNIKVKYVVTVMNKRGEKNVSLRQYYSPTRKIKKIQATIYDQHGNQIKKYTESKFSDLSALQNSNTIASDDRIKVVNHVASKFPYTIDYEYEIETSNTGFLPAFYFNGRYNQSVGHALFTMTNTSNIPLRYKEYNFPDTGVEKIVDSETELKFEATNLKAILYEEASPSYSKIFPHVKLSLEEFTLENVQGKVTDWKTMGIWQNDYLLKDRRQLPEQTIAEVTKLVADATTNIEKAERIYNYVQNKTRYISIQLGIGGWMPMRAEDVDRLGYGDCKALTNYTKALLDSQNIPAYYSLVHSGDKKTDISNDFVSLQGNHVILNLPTDGADVWLECTSQTNPFGFIAGFTDDRDVLVMTPNGGEIKRTKKYTAIDNLIYTKATIDFLNDNSLIGNFERKSYGINYRENKAIEYSKDKQASYQNEFFYLNNFKIKELNTKDNKDSIEFVEKFKFSVEACASKAGTRYIFTPNMFNKYQKKFSSKEKRMQPYIIQRGYTRKDEYVITIAPELSIHSLSKNKKLSSSFAEYSYKISSIEPQQIKIERFLQVKEGSFSAEKQEELENFLKEVSRNDNSKIILIKK